MKLIVGLDGLHRSGKGIQISLLQLKLEEQNIPYVIARGDGTRRGTGSSSFDYPSNWWRENWDYFQDKSDRSSTLDKLNLKFQRLNREARVYFCRSLEKEMKKRNSKAGIMIMDRTIPSRYFTMRSFYPDIIFNESIKSYNPKNGFFVQAIIPDLVFIMHAPKEVLLKRLVDTIESEKDFYCKLNTIRKYYASFEEIINLIADKERYIVLDSTQDSRELSRIIWDRISQKIKQ